MYLYADWLRHAARGGRKPTEAERAERVDLEREIPRDIHAERGLVGVRVRVRVSEVPRDIHAERGLVRVRVRVKG